MNSNIDLLGLNNPDYDNTFETKCDLNIWDIENNEKQQLILHIDNIISAKFEKKILDQNKIIDELKKENDGIKETINNLFFDLVNSSFGNLSYIFNKYNKIVEVINEPLELEYIDYSLVSNELEENYKKHGYVHSITKNISKGDMKSYIKKITLNTHQLENIDLDNKIFLYDAPDFIPRYYRHFVKNINVRRERFCYDDRNNILYINIMNYMDEKRIKQQNPDIRINFIPSFP